MKTRELITKVIVTICVAMIAASTAFSQSSGTPRKETLLNGLKVLMWNDAGAAKVMVRIRIHAGSAFDPQGKEGVMQLLANNIFPNEAAREFFAQDLGGGLDVNVNYDYIQIDASAEPDRVLTVIETLSSAVANPGIDKETTERLKTELAARIKALETDAGYVADQAVRKRFFGSFPYGRPQLGTEDSLKRVDFADLIDAKARFLTADNATITVYGNFDRALVFKAIRRYFGAWLKSDRRVPSTFRQPDDPQTAMLSVPSPKSDVSAIRFIARAPSRSDKDFAAANIFAAILESRLKARAPAAYAGKVSVRNAAQILPGWMMIGFDSEKLAVVDGKVEANDILAKALSAAVSDGEFQTARAALAAEWAKREMPLFWLDNDTYKTVSPDADRKIYDTVTINDVKMFAEKFKAAPMAVVLVNTPN